MSTEKTLLVTGATGFLGSSLAANFLSQGHPVITLSRNDPTGERTREAVCTAALGFGLPLDAGAIQRLRVLSFENMRVPLEEARIREVWHCAAEMSYAKERVSQAMETNVGLTSRLYTQAAMRCPSLERFYYVSTAYTAPIPQETAASAGVLIPEALHARCDFQNSYQISKWSAEHTLSSLHRRYSVPVTLLRPSVVIGHSKTGWCVTNPAGYYQFVEAFRIAKQLGREDLQFELDGCSAVNLTSIDQITRAAYALSNASALDRAGFEVAHCASNSPHLNGWLLKMIGERAGVRYICAPPRNSFERRITQLLDQNRPFADSPWRFSNATLERLGRAPEQPTAAELIADTDYYLNAFSVERAAEPGLRTLAKSATSANQLSHLAAVK